ncbi:MAG: M50 family metallopeptidase [Methylococcales bacterium]|nr:M50 family metallopeptidase [Methylococcales bacterium]
MKQLAYLIFLMGLITYFWEHPVLYPLKLLVVFFHESSHALATVLTGGQVKEFVINYEQGGHVVSLGGNRFIILSSGYLGSLLWGVIIYVASVQILYDKVLMGCLGVSIILITVLLSSSKFSWLFGLTSGIGMLVIARFLANSYNDFLLRLLGLTSMIYVPLDIYSDTIFRAHLESDAYMLAQHTGGSTVLWGSLWIAISLIVIYYCLKWSLVKQNQTRIKKHESF